MNTWLGAVLGGLAGLGIVVALVAFIPRPETTGSTQPNAVPWRRYRWRFLAAVGVGLVTVLVTGWPVAGIALAALTWVAPRVFGPDTANKTALATTEAVAAWTESLRDVIEAAAGLEQAIIASAQHPAPAIAEPLTRLADRLRHGDRPESALRAFAGEVDNETCDLVVTSLTMAASRGGGSLAPMLTELAAAARSHAALRMEVAASRARIRTSVRIITAVTVTMIAALLILNGEFFAPFSSLTGQLVLTLIASVFAGSLAWLNRLATITPAPRILATGEVTP